MKYLKLALSGTEPALMAITDQIQYHKLSEEDEKDILYPSEKDTNNPYLKYLQACLYAFGSKSVNRDPKRVKNLVNSVGDNADASAGWVLNLGYYLAENFPEEYSSPDKEKILQKAARLNNPYAALNLANLLNGKNNIEFVSILTQLYKRLLPNKQKQVLISINKLGALPDTQKDSDLCLAIGNFYKEINQPEQAKIFYLKSGSADAWVYCQRNTSKESEKKLSQELNKNLNDLRNIKEELSTQKISMNSSREEFESLKAISKAVRDRLDHMKYEIELILGSFGKNKNFANSDLGKLVVSTQTILNTTEKLLANRDEAIQNAAAIPEILGATKELAEEARLLGRDFKTLKTENEKLKKEISELQDELKKAKGEEKQQETDEESFFTRYGSHFKK